MWCRGNYLANDRVCELCKESNNAEFNRCTMYAKQKKEREANEVIIKFFEKHCPYTFYYYAEGEDRVDCSLDKVDGECVGRCTPFEYDCVYKRINDCKIETEG